MTPDILINQGILALFVVGGWFLGKYLHRIISNKSNKESSKGELTRLGETVGFVGGAAGILLGLLLVFAVQHYADAQDAARAEAVNNAKLFYSLGSFNESESIDTRQTLLCYMESVTAEDWKATAAGDVTGAENTTAWTKELRSKILNLTLEDEKQSTGYFILVEHNDNIPELRQFRLLIAQPQIPGIVWFVIYLASFVLSALLALQLADRKYLGRVSISATYVILGVTVAALGVLDHPFAEGVASLQPVAMQGTIQTLQDSYPEAIPSDCPVLAVSDFVAE